MALSKWSGQASVFWAHEAPKAVSERLRKYKEKRNEEGNLPILELPIPSEEPEYQWSSPGPATRDRQDSRGCYTQLAYDHVE